MPVYKYKLKSGKTMWYIKANFIDPETGKSVQRCIRGFETKREAKEHERQFMQNPSLKPAERSTTRSEPLFSDVYNEYQEYVKNRNIRPDTLQNKIGIYKYHIEPFFKDVPIKSMTVGMVKQWQTEMEKKTYFGKPYTPTYLRTVQSQLNAILNYAVRKGIIPHSPMVDLKNMGRKDAKEMEVWSTDEYAKFAVHAQRRPESFMFFELCYWLGLRRGEALAISPSDITHDTNGRAFLSITKSCNPKGVVADTKTLSSHRTLVLPPILEQELNEYMSHKYGLKPTDRIITVYPHILNRDMREAVKEAGIKKIRIHDLRHSYASNLINSQRYSPTDIARTLGHSSAAITLRTYSHMLENTKYDIADLINEIRGKIV